MLQDYNLYSPNQETVRAHIINILEGLLVKPALLSKKIFNEFLENLADIKDIIVTEKDIETHLNSKYFENLNSAIEKEIFRSLWKIVFKIEDAQCNENREINFVALKIILKRNYNVLIAYIKEESLYFSNNLNFAFFDLILRFLNNNPTIFDCINGSAKTLIENKINQDSNYLFSAWFLNKTLINHLKILRDNKDLNFDLKIEINSIKELNKTLINQGLLRENNELSIMIYGRSRTFDQADLRFEYLIQPILERCTLLELAELVKEVHENGQINGRKHAK
jgi:hypothetical protein